MKVAHGQNNGWLLSRAEQKFDIDKLPSLNFMILSRSQTKNKLTF